MRARLITLFLIMTAIAAGVIEGEIVSFTATPRRVPPGATVTLEWVTRGMTSVALDWAPAADTQDNWRHRGGLPASGSLEMKPDGDTVYVLSCETAGGGSACASSTVHVEVEPK